MKKMMFDPKEMDARFIPYIEHLHPKLQALILMTPVTPTALSKDMCERGVYLLSEGEKHLYIGRSNNIRQRLADHCRPSAGHGKATFAFLLAREATGNLKATYKPGPGSREALEKDPIFATAFDAAKSRIGKMDVRFVEETEPIKQALLEIYISIVLQTPHNDFDNH